MLPVPIRRPYEVERTPQTRLVALLSLLLRFSDLAVLAGAAFAAHWLRFGEQAMSIEFERGIARSLLFALLILGPSSAYRGWRAKDWSPHALRLLGLWLAVFVMGVLYVALLKVDGITSRLWWGYWLVGTLVGSFAMRAVCRRISRWAHANGRDISKAVVVGSPEAVSQVLQDLRASEAEGIAVLGWFAAGDMAHTNALETSRLGSIESLGAYVAAHDVKQVWIALNEGVRRHAAQILEVLQHSTADIKYVPNLEGDGIFNGSVEQLNGRPVMGRLVRGAPCARGIEAVSGVPTWR